MTNIKTTMGDFLNEARSNIKIKLKTGTYDCKLEFSEYKNGRTAIIAVDAKDPSGAPVCVATVNIPGEDIEKDEVIIKDYSENEGVLQSLISAGIISKPLRMVGTGFVECPVCKLLIKI